MEYVDLNFLDEKEVQTIVMVIEKDFELKAAEKSRLCRLRKTLIHIDQKSSYISRVLGNKNACIICGKKFIPLIGTKRTCCSCGIIVCGDCSFFVKCFNNFFCKICQKQKDLLAMNCTWFYENMRQKYNDGGSQIVVNSLSEYPKKNITSHNILSMVKGAQITKFKHQIQKLTNIICESLMKVENQTDVNEDDKTKKYSEMISKYSSNLRQILKNTAQVLYINLANYNNKRGFLNHETDMDVLTTLHEEIELMIGKKINIKFITQMIQFENKKLETLEPPLDLETVLSAALVDKLCCDHIQYMMDLYQIPWNQTNSYIRSLTTSNNIPNSLDYELYSVSQAPSRQNTIRKARHLSLTNPNYKQSILLEQDTDSEKISQEMHQQQNTNATQHNDTDEDSNHSSTMYKLSNRKESVHNLPNVSRNSTFTRSEFSNDIKKPLISNTMKVDSDVLSMISNETTTKDADEEISPTKNLEPNWVMKARCPRLSLDSFNANISEEIKKPSTISKIPQTERRHNEYRNNQQDLFDNLDDDIDSIYRKNTNPTTSKIPTSSSRQPNLVRQSDHRESNINREYRRNYLESVIIPNGEINPNATTHSEESQDSGIGITQVKSPLSRSNSIRLSKSQSLQRMSSIKSLSKVPIVTRNVKAVKCEYDVATNSGSDIDK